MSTNEVVDFSRYGKVFQETLAALILNDRAFCDQMQEVLKTEYFELKYLQVFIEKIFQYKEKYKVHPSSKIMTSIFRTELEDENEAVKNQTRHFFARIYNTEVTDSDYIKLTALDFCRK